MKSKLVAIFVLLVIVVATVAPSEARSWGHGGRFHHGGFRGFGCCWWGPAAIAGGVALGLGAALAWPFYAAAAAPVYAAPPVVYAPPPVVYQQPAVVYTPPPVAYQAPPAAYQPPAAAYQSAPVQREVVYPHGKYVLYGDGVSQPWQWVWVPTGPPPAPPAPPVR